MWQQIKKLDEQRAELLGQLKQILNTAETEKRDLSAEESGKFDEISAKAEALKAQSDRLKKAYDLEQDLQNRDDRNDNVRPGRHDVNTDDQDADQAADEYREQLDRWLRGGNPLELRSLTISGAGGVVGDRPFQSRIVESMKSFAGVLEAGAEVLTTSTGNPFSIPTADDTSNVAVLVGEAGDGSAEGDPTLDSIEMGAYKFDSKWVKVSLELLRDAAYDVEAYVTRAAGERIGRALNQYSVSGTGVAQPQGFVTAGSVGKVAAAVNAITYDEWIDFEHSLDPAYRNSGRCKIMLNDLTLAALRKLKDGSGRYIWTPGGNGLPATLDGYSYVVNNSMATLASGANSVVAAIGDWSRYVVRAVALPELIRANELFISNGLVGFKVFQRIDAKLTDANAVKLLKLAAA